jgi:hypothetical protein
MCLAVVGVAACSSSSSTSSSTSAGGTTAVTTAPESTITTTARPAGPSATLTAISASGTPYMAEASPPDLAKAGYTEREYVAAGTATDYKATGALTGDGRWTFAPATTAPYRTRVLVRAPADPSKFSGTVIVEWLNVSAGIDTDPEWASFQEEIERAGDAWVGVSAQRIGVVGGPVLVRVTGIPGADVAGEGLVKLDPARYSSLTHPGDGFSYDIFTEVARAVRGGAGLDGGATPRVVLAAGESQSAFALVTYINGVQPLTHEFDGFLVHSRGALGLPLVAPGKYADLTQSLSGTAQIFRTDQHVKIMDIQTETDVSSILDSYAARQPDTSDFRLWEVAGTAHADAHLTGAANAAHLNCGVPINDGDMHIVAKAALRALTTWVTTGKAPLIAPRLDIVPGTTPTVKRNADGIALGGIRTPPVDVPTAVVSGAPGPNPSTICLLLGSAKPLSSARIAQLYSSRADYMRKFTADVDRTIKAGFALPQDRAAMLGFAEPNRVPAG